MNRANTLHDLNWTAFKMHRAGYSLNMTALHFTPFMFKQSGLSIYDACMAFKPTTFRIRDVRSDCAYLARAWYYDDELQKVRFKDNYGHALRFPEGLTWVPSRLNDT